MTSRYRLAWIPGEGIGPEVTGAALEVLRRLGQIEGFSIEETRASIGSEGMQRFGEPLPSETIEVCESSDAILFGAVTQGGLLELRQHFDFFINLRPVTLLDSLKQKSALRLERVVGLDILFVRELTSGIYFGPAGRRNDQQGDYGFHTMLYYDWQIRRIAQAALAEARTRKKRLTVAHKENALPFISWIRCVQEEATQFPDISLEFMLVDNLAMQLILCPTHFDVVLAENLFGDILSDIGGALVGSIGLLGSASLNSKGFGLYEPIHGTAPEIAGQGIANPVGCLESARLMLEQWGERSAAQRLETGILSVFGHGYRTKDLKPEAGEQEVSTQGFIDQLLEELALV